VCHIVDDWRIGNIRLFFTIIKQNVFSFELILYTLRRHCTKISFEGQFACT